MVYHVSGAAPAAQMEEFRRKLFETSWKASGDGWHARRRRQMRDGDLVLFRERDETEQGETLHRRNWIRLGIRDAYVIVAPIHLVTAHRYLDEPAQIESEAPFHREVENALMSRPAPDSA